MISYEVYIVRMILSLFSKKEVVIKKPIITCPIKDNYRVC
jgi:hypothetical protein